MKEWPPFPKVFFEDDEWLAPGQLKKYGYRLKRGMPYRLYSMTEIKKMIEDGRVVRVEAGPNLSAPKDRKVAR